MPNDKCACGSSIHRSRSSPHIPDLKAENGGKINSVFIFKGLPKAIDSLAFGFQFFSVSASNR
jgi:hypothetical protein